MASADGCMQTNGVEDFTNAEHNSHNSSPFSETDPFTTDIVTSKEHKSNKSPPSWYNSDSSTDSSPIAETREGDLVDASIELLRQMFPDIAEATITSLIMDREGTSEDLVRSVASNLCRSELSQKIRSSRLPIHLIYDQETYTEYLQRALHKFCILH